MGPLGGISGVELANLIGGIIGFGTGQVLCVLSSHGIAQVATC